MADAVYEFDPRAAPDADFEPGRLEHLVAGSEGRLLDPRRTPVTVVAVEFDVGMFEIEVGAFEDAGARWRVPLEEVGRFQFRRDAATAPAALVARYQACIERLDGTLALDADAGARAATAERLERERARTRRELDRLGVPPALDPAPCIERRTGSTELAEVVRMMLTARDLLAVDDAFVAQYVSNPWSGELIKGHAIVAAELGLHPYRGKAVRDPRLFDGDWSKARRAEHLIVRLALTSELWRRAGAQEVTLYRALSSETAIRPQRPGTFVSATFALAVAQAHFAGSAHTRAAALYRQAVAVERLLMTFWETPGMNERFAEAEALLIAGDEGPF